MYQSILLVALISLGASNIALANHHENGAPADGQKCEGMHTQGFSISGLDKDKDGFITKAEYLSGDASNTEKVFSHIDINSDGKLDQDEQKQIEAIYKSIHEEYKSKNTKI